MTDSSIQECLLGDGSRVTGSSLRGCVIGSCTFIDRGCDLQVITGVQMDERGFLVGVWPTEPRALRFCCLTNNPLSSWQLLPTPLSTRSVHG